MSELGSGSFATVHEGRDRELGDVVAIKVPREASTTDFLSEQAEFQFLADAVHPNLVGYHELAWAHDRPVLVLERLHGKPLREALAGEDGTTNDAAPFTRLSRLIPGMVRGLAALHARGLAHRDVKPDNLLVTDGGQAVWLDFGLSAAFGTGQGIFAGTPDYMAPEQLFGHAAEAASDWYSLGAVLFDAVTGSLPWGTRPSRPKTAPDPRESNPAVPSDLAALIQGLLAHDPGTRPTSASLLTEFGTAEQPPRIPEQHRPSDALGLARLREAFAAACAGDRRALLLRGTEAATTLADWFVSREVTNVAVYRARCHARDSVPFSGVQQLCVDATSRSGVDRAAFREQLVNIAEQAAPRVLHIADAQWLDEDSARLLLSIKETAPGLLLLLSTQQVSPRLDGIVRRWATTVESISVEPSSQNSSEAKPLGSVERHLCAAVAMSAEPLTTAQLIASLPAEEQPNAARDLRKLARQGWLLPLERPGLTATTAWTPRLLLELEPDEKARLHGRLLDVFAEVDPPSPHAMMVHALGAKRNEAKSWALQAAREAITRGAFGRAGIAWRHAARLEDATPGQYLRSAANAFEQAGQLTDAAQCLSDAEGLTPRERVRAARLWMYGGGFVEGEMMFRAALADAGAWLPRSDRLALLLGMLARIPEMLSRIRVPPPSAPSGASVSLDAMWAAMSALSVIRPPASTFLSALYLRAARRSGAPGHFFRGLCYEAVFIASIGGPFFRKRALRLLELSDQLPGKRDNWESSFHVQASGVVAWMRGDWAASALHCEEAGRRMGDVGRSGSWEEVSTTVYHLSSLCWAGDFSNLERLRQEAEDGALERGDRWAIATLRVGDLAVGLLAADLPDLAAERADATRQWWPKTEFPLLAYQHLMLLARVDLYKGDGESALGRLDDAWKPMQRTGILSLEMPRVLLLGLRGLALLQTANQPRGLKPVLRGLSKSKLPVASALRDMLSLASQEDGGADESWATLGGRFDTLGMRLHQLGCLARAGEPMPTLRGVQNASALTRIATPQRLK